MRCPPFTGITLFVLITAIYAAVIVYRLKTEARREAALPLAQWEMSNKTADLVWQYIRLFVILMLVSAFFVWTFES